jgi:hypothetical protein
MAKKLMDPTSVIARLVFGELPEQGAPDAPEVAIPAPRKAPRIDGADKGEGRIRPKDPTGQIAELVFGDTTPW